MMSRGWTLPLTEEVDRSRNVGLRDARYVPYKIQRALNGGRGGLLSHTEEADLGPGAQSGDGEARLQLTVCVAREYRGRGLPFEDLI